MISTVINEISKLDVNNLDYGRGTHYYEVLHHQSIGYHIANQG